MDSRKVEEAVCELRAGSRDVLHGTCRRQREALGSISTEVTRGWRRWLGITHWQGLQGWLAEFAVVGGVLEG
jgi:hypothetical protein